MEYADVQSGFWLFGANGDSPIFRHWMEVEISRRRPRSTEHFGSC